MFFITLILITYNPFCFVLVLIFTTFAFATLDMFAGPAGLRCGVPHQSRRADESHPVAIPVGLTPMSARALVLVLLSAFTELFIRDAGLVRVGGCNFRLPWKCKGSQNIIDCTLWKICFMQVRSTCADCRNQNGNSHDEDYENIRHFAKTFRNSGIGPALFVVVVVARADVLTWRKAWGRHDFIPES